MVDRDELTAYMNQLLDIDAYKDYGPNGLQVEGKKQIKHIVCGVTASQALIDAALKKNADAILVHHGLFWRGQDGRVVGWMKQRLHKLLCNEVNLYGYHLPLDAHPTLGNNAMLGQHLGLTIEAFIGEQNVIALGVPNTNEAITLTQLKHKLQMLLQREVTVVVGDGRPLRKIGWCTGGGQGFFEQAITAGADAYITGEISEPQTHYAREMGIAYMAGGHHATERFGVQALAAVIQHEFDVTCEYIEIDNPA